MSVHKSVTTVTASSQQVVTFGKIYTSCSFYVQSGTGSGAIKVSVRGGGGTNYLPPSPNRLTLAAGMNPYKVTDLAMDAVTLKASGTTSLSVILINAWNEAT